MSDTRSPGQKSPSTPIPRKAEDNILSQDDLVYASAELSFSDVDDWFEKLSNQTEHKRTSQTKPPVPDQASTTESVLIANDDDDIQIPTIFLTQGAKNSRLLRQSEEINRQMTEDELRMQAQAQELTDLQNKFLAELNDNGSDFTYSMKSDHELVEKYVQKHYAKDQTLATHRHFFYFREVEINLESLDNDVLKVLTTVLTPVLSVKNHDKLRRILARNNIETVQLVNYALVHVKNETVLDLIGKFLHMSDLKSDADTSIDTYMDSLGAIITKDLPLKLVHYNNTPRLLIHRLCIVFFYRLLNASQQELESIVTHFVLTISDFILNSREKPLLMECFAHPVFRSIVSKLGTGVIPLIERVLDKIHTHIYGEKNTDLQKNEEIRFNVLNILWTCFCKDNGDPGKIVLQLGLDYLKFDNAPEYSVPSIATVISQIGHTNIGADVTIYKNMYRAQMASSLLVNLIYSSEEKQKKEYLNLREKLLECKDNLQECIGRLLYMKTDEVPKKATLSMALSETYHTIDHFGMVLDKNMAFLKIDLFYENE